MTHIIYFVGVRRTGKSTYQQEIYPTYFTIHENEEVLSEARHEYFAVHRTAKDNVLSEQDFLVLEQSTAKRTLIHFSSIILVKRYDVPCQNIIELDRLVESIYSLFDEVLIVTDDLFDDENRHRIIRDDLLFDENRPEHPNC